MKVMTVTNYQNSNQASFKGAKEGQVFRREANKLIAALGKAGWGSPDYTWTSVHFTGEKSLQQRLREAIFIKADDIGSDFVTPEDRRLHEQLKKLFISFEKGEQGREDFLACGCGQPRIPNDPPTVNFSI